MRDVAFAKGHGTLNDFVLVTDPDDTLHLTDDDVRFLCDRRAGIGADGLLRAVRAGHLPGWAGDPEMWFMDYRNADASIAEMCGNGLRVFVQYLVEEGLASGRTITVGTRAGVRTGTLLDDSRIDVTMGPVRVDPDRVEVSLAGRSWQGVPVDVGNPHVVSTLAPVDDLDALDLHAPPVWTPKDRFPEGVNAEFVQLVGPGHLRMRVHERGSGETWSCGTGIVACAAATAFHAGAREGRWTVDVPGGRLEVLLAAEGARLVGPAVIVARGTVRLDRGWTDTAGSATVGRR